MQNNIPSPWRIFLKPWKYSQSSWEYSQNSEKCCKIQNNIPLAWKNISKGVKIYSDLLGRFSVSWGLLSTCKRIYSHHRKTILKMENLFP
jgi:hypothetical protein